MLLTATTATHMHTRLRSSLLKHCDIALKWQVDSTEKPFEDVSQEERTALADIQHLKSLTIVGVPNLDQLLNLLQPASLTELRMDGGINALDKVVFQQPHLRLLHVSHPEYTLHPFFAPVCKLQSLTDLSLDFSAENPPSSSAMEVEHCVSLKHLRLTRVRCDTAASLLMCPNMRSLTALTLSQLDSKHDRSEPDWNTAMSQLDALTALSMDHSEAVAVSPILQSAGDYLKSLRRLQLCEVNSCWQRLLNAPGAGLCTAEEIVLAGILYYEALSADWRMIFFFMRQLQSLTLQRCCCLDHVLSKIAHHANQLVNLTIVVESLNSTLPPLFGEIPSLQRIESLVSLLPNLRSFTVHLPTLSTHLKWETAAKIEPATIQWRGVKREWEELIARHPLVMKVVALESDPL
jgi:hypothetical protein